MPLPSITITTETIAQPPAVRIDEIVGVIAPAGSDAIALGAGETFVHGNTLVGTPNPLAAALGTNGDAFEAITDLLAQVQVDIVYAPLDISTGSPTPAQILTRFNAAADAIQRYSRGITTILVPRDYHQAANGTGASTMLAALNTLCARIFARGVVSTPQDTGANAVAFWLANRAPYLWGVFNGAAGRLPAGAFLGGALRTAALNREGRAHGIQLQPVSGISALQHSLNLGVTDLTNLDAASVCSIILHNGQHRIAGGDFHYASDTELQRNWSIARVVDHAKHLLLDRWDTLVSSTRPLSVLATRLEEALTPIIGIEVQAATVTGLRAAGGTKDFQLDLSLIHPTERITVHIALTEVEG